jgi:hypothetical protein
MIREKSGEDRLSFVFSRLRIGNLYYSTPPANGSLACGSETREVLGVFEPTEKSIGIHL